MTTWLPRSAWTTHGKPSGLVPMPSRPKGIAVHWPGTTAAIGDRTQANIANRLEGYRRFHTSGRGWTDIAYQAAIDQDGRVWDLRGIEHQSAANGDQDVNRRWLACLFLLGPGETPSDEMRRAFADFRHRALMKYPTATQVVGHQDIRPHGGTDCPGPITARLIHTGTLLTVSEENPMANLTDDDAAKIAKALAGVIPSAADNAKALLTATVGAGADDSPGTFGGAQYRQQSELMRLTDLVADTAELQYALAKGDQAAADKAIERIRQRDVQHPGEQA